MVTGDSEMLKQFRKADQTSGQLENTMRLLVGRVRNAPDFWRTVGRLVPKGLELLKRVQADLAPLGGQTETVVQEQRKAVEQLLSRQQAYLSALLEAHAARKGPEPGSGGPEGAPLPLPPPGKRVDFGSWREQEEKFVKELEEAVVAQRSVPLEQVIGLARLACNSSHELQNLASAPRGAFKSPAHEHLKAIDKLGGQCENASRAAMVLAHRAHQRQRLQPLAKVAKQALLLQKRAEHCASLLDLAV